MREHCGSHEVTALPLDYTLDGMICLQHSIVPEIRVDYKLSTMTRVFQAPFGSSAIG